MMKRVDQLEVAGKRVFVRVDFNVPLRDGAVSDDTRIRAALPTLRYLIDAGARVIVASHLGRPKGQVKPELSLAPVARRLSELLGMPVAIAPDCIGPDVEKLEAQLLPGQILLLENVRFHAAEEKNDPEFARALARLADVYVDDAFGAAHRAHASTVGMVGLVAERAAGFLLRTEVDYLSRVIRDPERPLVAILGGAKVSDKSRVVDHLIDKVDSILIGGAMAYTFLRAQGVGTGTSFVEEGMLDIARQAIAKAERAGVRMLLPVDHVVASGLDAVAASGIVAGDIPEGMMGLDIGPMSVEQFRSEIERARTVFWNGPVGLFENPAFRAGTVSIALALAKSSAVSIVGGGDSLAAIATAGVADRISHMSTGGGASLEFIEGRELPGISALEVA